MCSKDELSSPANSIRNLLLPVLSGAPILDQDIQLLFFYRGSSWGE